MPSRLDATLDVLARLVAFRSVSSASNLDIVGFIADHLTALGISSTLTFDDAGRKANLLATIGNPDNPGIVLSGHTDVVPVEGQDWKTDPFSLHVADGRAYGRGACDMKAFLAVLLAVAGDMERRRLSTPLHFAFSFDEEVGCLGVPHLIADLPRRGVRAMGCIVGEPTGMNIAVAHKGKAEMRCTVRGIEAHSSLVHSGINAIELASELVGRLRRMGRLCLVDGPLDARFDPPGTTIQVGTISGGVATNIIPAECRFEFEIRTLPGRKAAALLAEIRAFADEKCASYTLADGRAPSLAWEGMSDFPGLSVEPSDAIVDLARTLGETDSLTAISFGTEAGLFAEAGIPTVVIGPGDIGQAHKPDEFIAIEQIAACERFMDRLVERAEMPPQQGFPQLFEGWKQSAAPSRP